MYTKAHLLLITLPRGKVSIIISSRHARLPRNSAVFDIQGVIFVIHPDPRRIIFPIRGRGVLWAFLRDFQLKMENNVTFWGECFVFLEVETHCYTLFNTK